MKKRTLSWVAAVLAAGMLAAACSKPAKVTAGKTTSGGSNDQVNSGTTPQQAGDTTTTAAGAPGSKPGVPGGTNNPANPGGPPASVYTAPIQSGNVGTGDQTVAQRIGAQIHPQTTQRSQPYYNGVGNNTITLDFDTDPTSCGVNVVNAITAAGGALPAPTRFYRAAATTQDTINAETNESIRDMVLYWNSHGFQTAQYSPSIRKLMGNDPNNQYYGRHFVANIIDAGSNQCPDKTKAASVKAAQEDHAFAVFDNLAGLTPAGAYNMAADLNAVPPGTRPMHFGTLWLSDQDYNRFAPYDWTQFASGTTIFKGQASYVCSTLVGKNASRSPDTSLQKQKRVFGLIHTNLDQDVRLANEFKGYLQQDCGKNIIVKEVAYDGTDFSKAQQDDLNLITQLKVANVTSVLMMTDPIQPLFMMKEAKSQNYSPEWIFSSYGYEDSSTAQRVYDQTETAGDFGTSTLGSFGGFGFGAGDPFYMYHSEHLVAPDGKKCDPSSNAGMEHGDGGNGTISRYCKAPDALVTWYYTMLPMVAGVIFSGPDLKPQTVSAGLQAYPITHYGGGGPTSDARGGLVGAGAGKYNFLTDSVEWRWRPDFTSPPPESKANWVEYPDCQRQYFAWPNQLATGWETNGSNYNAWCGDPKKGDYPKTIPTDGT